jgi:tetratricopeptide (TPR) repeat protein
MPADRDTRNRLLALLGLWFFASGLLSALSFVEVAFVGSGVLLFAGLAWGAVWIVRSSEVPWKVGALVAVAARQGGRLADSVDRLALPLRTRRLASRAARRVAEMRAPIARLARRAGSSAARLPAAAAAAGEPAARVIGRAGRSAARLPARAAEARAPAARVATRARRSAANLPRRAPLLWARTVRAYALAVYWTQWQLARALNAAAARQTRGARRQALQLNALGARHRRRGDAEYTAEQHRIALAIARDLGDEQAEAMTLNNLALTLAQTGAEEEAVEHLEQARIVLHELGDEEREAQVIANLGIVHRRRGHPDIAQTLLHEALEKLPPESTAYRQVAEELARAG